MKKILIAAVCCVLSLSWPVTANAQSKDYSTHQGKANYTVLKDQSTMDHTKHDARVKAEAVGRQVEKKAKEAEQKAKNDAAKEQREKIRKEQEKQKNDAK